MKKLILLFYLLLAGYSIAQVDPYTKAAIRDSIANLKSVRIAPLETTVSSHTSTISSHTATIAAHTDSINNLRDDLESYAAASTVSLEDGKIYIGGVTNVPVAQTISGALALTRAGVASINSNYITDAMISSATNISLSKIGGDAYTIDLNEWYALDGLTGNIQEQIDAINYGTGYFVLTSATTQTSTSKLKFNDGGVRYVNTDVSYSASNVMGGITMRYTHPTLSTLWNGDFYGHSGIDNDGSGEGLYTLNAVFLDGSYNKILVVYWDSEKIIRYMSDFIKYEEASLSEDALDTLDFSDTRIVTDWFGGNDTQVVEVINYEPRTISCIVSSTEGVTFDFNGKTVKYADGLGLPGFIDGKIYLVTMIYSRNMVLVSYLEYRDAL